MTVSERKYLLDIFNDNKLAVCVGGFINCMPIESLSDHKALSCKKCEWKHILNGYEKLLDSLYSSINKEMNDSNKYKNVDFKSFKIENKKEILRSISKDIFPLDIEKTFIQWMIDEFYYVNETKIHDLLIETSFPYIVTTNIDRQLEKTAREKEYHYLYANSYSLYNAGKLSLALYKGNEAIIHLFGDMNSLTTTDFITDQDSFDRLYKKYVSFSLALQLMFIKYYFMFFGFTVEDERFLFLIKFLKRIIDTNRIHFRVDNKPTSYYSILINSSEKTMLERILDRHKEYFHVFVYNSDEEVISLLQEMRSAGIRNT